MKGVHVVLRWALAGALLVVLGVGVVPTILKETALATPPASCDLPIYQDNLAAGWSDASWNVTYNFADTHAGLRRQRLDRGDDHQRLRRAVGAAW
jgi:hypothetical protein